MWRETRRSIANFVWSIFNFSFFTNGKAKISGTKSCESTELTEGTSCSQTKETTSKTPKTPVNEKSPLLTRRMDASILVAPRKNRVSRKIIHERPLWITKLKYNEYCG